MCHSPRTFLDFHLSRATLGFGEISSWQRYAVHDEDRWQVVQITATTHMTVLELKYADDIALVTHTEEDPQAAGTSSVMPTMR